MKATKCKRKKKWDEKSEKRREEKKRKVKVKTAVSLFEMPELRKLMFWGHQVYDLSTGLW